MRRWMVAAGLLVAVGAHLAAPVADGRDRPPVAGSGKDAAGRAFAFEADGDGFLATGRIRFAGGPEGVVEGTVDCVFVSENRAALSGFAVVEAGEDGPFLLAVEDNGRNRGRRPKDEVFLDLDPGTNCALLPVALPERIKRGNVRVG